MRTEPVWEGKYDEYGSRREVDIAGLAMPLQKIETIHQPRAEAAEAGEQQLLAFAHLYQEILRRRRLPI